MLKTVLAVLLLALGACATTSPPTAPTCEGDLVPINAKART